MFFKDKWLTEQIGKNVYQLIISNSPKDDFVKNWENFKVEHANENYLIFSKINTCLVSMEKALIDADFKLIDTNLKFELKEKRLSAEQQNDFKMCFSEKKHQDAIQSIARDNFSYSRFHIDPKIDNDIANQIKHNWVKSYFLGERGDAMVVAILDNEPVAFLQLIVKENQLIIDLIGVAERAQRMGIASSMINFASTNIKRPIIKVGTQIGNLPSTKLYQKLGFLLTESYNVFHYHS